MKKIGIWIFIVFIVTAGSYAVTQSNIGRNWVRNLLADALQKSGYEVQIGQIEGTLPHQITLKNVSIQGEQIDLKIEQLSLRPVLWRLLKKEVAFTNIHANGISLSQGASFDFDGKFRMSEKNAFLQGKIGDWSIHSRLDRTKYFATFTAVNSLLNAKGQINLDSAYQFQKGKIQIGSNELLKKLSLQGRLLANVNITRDGDAYRARASWNVPKLKLKGKGEAVLTGRTLVGEFSTVPASSGNFHIDFTPEWLLAGTTEITIENIQSLRLPDTFGKVQAKAKWEPLNGKQTLQLDLTGTDFYYGSFFAQKATLHSELEDPFGTASGPVNVQIEKGKWNELTLKSANIETTMGSDWPLALSAEGEWKHPFEIQIAGQWKLIERFEGTFFNHPFSLNKPIAFEWADKIVRFPEIDIAVGDARILAQLDRNEGRTDAHIQLDALPIDFLSLNPVDIAVNGTLNLEADIHEKNNLLQGKLKATVQDFAPLDASGAFEGTFNRDLLSLKGRLDVRNRPLVDLDLSLPVHFSLWPFEASLDFHKSAKGNFSLNGQIEDFLDFLDFGPHRLEGECNCSISFTNNLYRPLVEGYLHFEDGIYENYFTGTHLENIHADFLLEKNTVFLRSLTGQDASKTGTLSATGKIDLLKSDLYPFRIDADIANLQFVEIDMVTASAQGQVRIEGNATSATAKGDVRILQSELSIPDHIRRPLPNLQVVYINPDHPIPPPSEDLYRPYPLLLDLHVHAPQAVNISGRGLESTWSGDFDLGGTYTSPAAKGKLELISGEFNFSGRSFKLTDGSLSLSGIEHQMPTINLAATTETKGVLITARLKGPLDNPQVTLQSVPPLPLGSIMSYLLFGQDLSEVSGFQALQIATSLASLAGTGPDVMESTRRALGVDRLRVITNPSEEGGETVALQVGKYVSEGVLVSFTQGSDDSSPNISVEIELRGNFVFQIESDQHQEQGKFTLKWNLNY